MIDPMQLQLDKARPSSNVLHSITLFSKSMQRDSVSSDTSWAPRCRNVCRVIVVPSVNNGTIRTNRTVYVTELNA